MAVADDDDESTRRKCVLVRFCAFAASSRARELLIFGKVDRGGYILRVSFITQSISVVSLSLSVVKRSRSIEFISVNSRLCHFGFFR